MDHRSVRATVVDRHTERGGDQGGGGRRVDGPADHSSAEHVEYHRAVDLAFAGAVLGDIGDPQLVRFFAGKVTVDEIRRGRCPDDARFAAPVTGKACQAGPSHQHRHRVVPHGDAVAHGEFGMDPRCPVGVPRCLVDLVDQVGQPRVSDRPSRRWAAPPGVVPGFGHPHHPARPLGRQSFRDDHPHRLEPSFGDITCAFNSSLARRVTANSVSSSLILRRAALSSVSCVSTVCRPPAPSLSHRSGGGGRRVRRTRGRTP